MQPAVCIPRRLESRRSKSQRPPLLYQAVIETLENRTLLSTVAGLDYDYYQGAWTTLPNFSLLTPIKSGVTHNADLSIRNVDTNYGFTWNGNINITTAGTYTFYAGSDDGSEISIDGTTVVANDGIHTYTEASGSVLLSAGLHSIGIEYFQSTAAQQLTISYAGPGISKQAIPDAVFTCTPPAAVDVATYHAVGNGTTNDSTAIQNAINATPDGGTLLLDAGKTYLLGTGLTVNHPINIEGNGATLLIDTSASTSNNTIFASSPLASASYTWTGAVAFGQTSFNVSISTNVLLPGDTVFLQLGTDTNDTSQPNYAEVCQVISNTGSVVTLSAGLPAAYANYESFFNQGANPNSIQRITDVIQNVTFQDVNFNYVAGTTPDAQVWLTMARNVTLNNLTGTATILGNLVDSENVTLTNSSANLVKLASSEGRLVTGWQDDNLTITNCTANDSYDSAVVFLESWARNTTISNLLINQTFSGNTTQDVFHFTGDSYGTYGNNITINNASPINLVLSGSQYANYSFGTVTVNGTIKSAPIWLIGDLITGGGSYNQNDTIISAPAPLTIGSNWSNFQKALASGVVDYVTFTITNWTGESSIIVTANNNGGFDLTPSNLPVNTPTTFYQFFGTDYPFNAPAYPFKTLSFYTSTVPAGTTLTWSVTYFQQPMVPVAPTATPVPGNAAQFNLSVLGGDPSGQSSLTYSWSLVSGPSGAPAPSFSINGTNAAKNTVATFFQVGTYNLLVKITDSNNLSVSPTLSVVVNLAIAQAAGATPNPVTGKTAALSMLTGDLAGESTVNYSWTVVSVPNGNAPAPFFSANGTNAAKNTTATFFQAGTYVLTGTATDASGNTVTSNVTVTVAQTVTEMYIQPPNVSTNPGAAGTQYSVIAYDQFSNPILSPPISWSVNGGGAISSAGLFTPTTDGSFTVTALSGGYLATTSVNITGSGSSIVNSGSAPIQIPPTDPTDPTTPTTPVVAKTNKHRKKKIYLVATSPKPTVTTNPTPANTVEPKHQKQKR